MDIRIGNQLDLKLLKNPPRDCEMCYSWTWNAPVTREGIVERLNGFVEAGIKALYILPLPKDFRPERLRTFLDPEYLSEDYFDLVSFAMREAERRGITTWIYDEGGWPSGGACGHTVRENPDAAFTLLEKRELTLECDQRYEKRADSVALYDGKRRLPDDYISSRNHTYTEYYLRTFIENGNRIDNTSETAIDTFIENTYEKYKEAVGDLFGEQMPLFFTDEPGCLRNTIPTGGFEKFKEKFGYDLRDYLYVIEDYGSECESEEEKRARIDFFTLIGELSRENTYRKLHDWCEKNGVYFSGHLDLDNRPWGAMGKGYFSFLDQLRLFHVPGIDVIWEQIRYPYGGREPLDSETLGMGFFPRLAPSAARQEGRNLALTETFSIYGDAVTPEEIKFALNFQAIRGINVFNFLTLPYGKSRCAALMMRPALCPEKPGFYNMKHINEYYGRLSYLLRLGKPEGDTALYHPIRDYCADPATMDDATAAYKRSGTELEEKNIAFDIIDDGVIRDARVTEKGLAIGGAVYAHIVVPECRYMPEDVKAKIAPFLGEGDPIYTPKSGKLRFMTRALDNGRLWFIFNEGIDTATEELDIADGRRLYRIDVASGKITEESVCSPTLLCGDIAVYLVTDDRIEADATHSEVRAAREVTGFKAISYKRFTVDHFGIHSSERQGAPGLDESFSGEVTYYAPYELPDEPKAGEVYRLRLEDTSVSASVRIDGKVVCDLGLLPMVTELDGSQLLRRGEIEITVANTAANELVAKEEFIKSTFPHAEVGAYATIYTDKMTEFEKRRPELKLGRVFIEKMV